MTISGDAVLAVVGTLGGTALGLFGSLLVWKLQRGAEKADRIENFQRENLLQLQDVLQEYYIATSKWIAAGQPRELAEPFYRVRVSILNCRSRSTDAELRTRLDTLVRAEPPAGEALDLQDLSNIYIGPIKPVRDRTDELLQA